MIKKTRIGISNMHCSNCSATVEKHFNKCDGIKVNVILSENEGIFTYDDTSWDEKKIEKHLKEIGYPKKKETQGKKDLIILIMCIILTIPFLVHMILMMCGIHMPSYLNYVQLALATIIEVLAGGPFFLGMLRDFKNKKLGMDVLVTLGTATAYIYSIYLMFAKSSHMLYFETCAMLLTIILIGKYIEKKAKKKTSSSLKSLMSLQEKNGKVLINNEIVEKSINDINIDDVLIISTGENIPLDGIVISGDAEVNEAMITGESMPVYKKVNDIVLAGTTIVSGNIHLKVNKTNENTYLSLLIKKVEDIQANKPRLQRLADKIASIFVPAVISISLIAFIVTFIINKDLATSINRAIAVLMVSCPCSLGLATPLSILVGSSRAINLQIIYNNTEIFEKASHINTICFDKTGTLSKGTFVVSEFESNVDNALDIIYTLESVSNHPIATSLVKFAKDNNAKLIKELKPKEIIGKGIECDDYFIYKENQTVKLLYKNEVIATLTLKDEIKEEAKEVIKQLHKQNIEVYILTGDSKDIAISVANELNIKQENVFYEIKPEDKLSIIENLKDAGKKVAFVGDGINDALALNKADLSISMGNGSDIAKSSSDITLTNSSLSSISSSIKLSKKVYINIIENFIWAFSYNIVAIPLAFIGILSPLIAGICMAFSNISVVLNALRLYKVKIGEKNGN